MALDLENLPDDIDAENLEALRNVAKKIGRAVCISVLAAQAPERIEDDAIARMDASWSEVADAFVEFAVLPD